MDFTISTVVYLVAGILILGIIILILTYFNGGVQNNIALMLGLLK